MTKKLDNGSKCPEKAAWMVEHRNAQCLPENSSRMFSKIKQIICKSRTRRLPFSKCMESHSRIVWARVSMVPGKANENKRGSGGREKKKKTQLRIMKSSWFEFLEPWQRKINGISDLKI